MKARSGTSNSTKASFGQLNFAESGRDTTGCPPIKVQTEAPPGILTAWTVAKRQTFKNTRTSEAIRLSADLLVRKRNSRGGPSLPIARERATVRSRSRSFIGLAAFMMA
jgi:hypothetical protein